MKTKFTYKNEEFVSTTPVYDESCKGCHFEKMECVWIDEVPACTDGGQDVIFVKKPKLG